MRIEAGTVVVTGGASGLGAATVDMVIAHGGRAVILDVNEPAGPMLSRAGERVRFFRGDVTSIWALFLSLSAQTTPPDISRI